MRTLLAAVLVAFLGVTACSPALSGKIDVADAEIVAPPPGVPTAAGYVKISNGTAKPVRLIGGTTEVAERVEIHQMSMDGGVMRMRQLSEGVEIPSAGSVIFSPNGMHLMLIGWKAPLKGTMVGVTLNFADAPPIDVQFALKALGGHEH